MTNKNSFKNDSNQRLKKRHWCLGTAVVLIGSWITHTSTAKFYNDFASEQALEYARAVPNSSTALRGSLPDSYLATPFQTTQGPLSDSIAIDTSPSLHLFGSMSTELPQEQSVALEQRVHKVKRGDTLGNIFNAANLGFTLPHNISQHPIAKQLVKLAVGSELSFGHDFAGQLQQITYPINPLQHLVVDLDADDTTKVANAEIIDLPFETVERVVSGNIKTSLYEAAIEAGLSIELVMEMVKIFGWDIDFVLDIRSGDEFHVVFEEFQLEGTRLADGGILAAEFTTQNQTHRAIRFTDVNGETSFYNPQGQSMLGTFLRSPVEFSRISSRFGKRKHPILKKWRAHKGVDYAASRGTPIRATADGKVIHAGNKGGYGRTVILRHAGRFSTLYAHMNGLAKGLRSGNRVKQGDVIGYIGSSGLATGPHLHYEFRLDGVHQNPLTFKTPKATAISSEEMLAFQALASQQVVRLGTLSTEFQLAKLSNLK